MDSQTLKPQTVRNAYYWTAIGYAVKNVCGFGISMLLARFLQPADYGLVGIVTVLINILYTIQDFGLAQAIVYFPEEEDVLPTVFTVTTAMGVLLMLIAVAGAPAVSGFYNEPRLTPIVYALSFTLLLAGLRAVPQGLMSKRLQFRRLAFLEGGGTLLAGVVGVAMAWSGFGVWSLVTNILLSSLLQTMVAVWLVRPRVSTTINAAVLKKMLRWGLPLTGATMLWQFYENSDFLVIGKLIGPVGLGYYTMAFRLATIVNDKISSIVNRVSFPTLSAMQDNSKHLVEHWFSVTRKLALINFPVLIALAIAGDDVIQVILGSRWMPAAAPLRYLCLVGAVKTVLSIINTLINVYGRTDLTFYMSCFNAVVMPISFVIGCKLGGITGVAIAWTIVHPLRLMVQLRQATKLAQVSIFSYLKNLKVPLLVSAICAAAMLPAHLMMAPGLLRLTVSSTAGVLAFCLCALGQADVRTQIRVLWSRA